MPYDFDKTPFIRPLSETKPFETYWFWPQYIPRCAVTLIVGQPGVGKSLLVAELAAWESIGHRLSANEPHDFLKNIGGSKALMIVDEDRVDATLIPRLTHAGANLTNILHLRGIGDDEQCLEHFQVSHHRNHLQKFLWDRKNLDICTCIIDPITAFLGRSEPTTQAAARHLLRPLTSIATQRFCSVIAVIHPTKHMSDTPLHRAAGTLAFAAIARSVLEIQRDPSDPDRRYLIQRKNNYGPLAPSLAFRIIEGPRIQWEQHNVPPEEIAALDARHTYQHISTTADTALLHATTWLTTALTPNPKPALELTAQAAAANITPGTLRRAKAALNITSHRKENAWHWALNERTPAGCQPLAGG